MVQMDLDGPEGPRVVFLRISGHSFGLVSAVTDFNALAEFTTHCSRRIGRAACGRYYDDFVIIDPARGRASAKEALHWMHDKLGIPLTRDAAKCTPMSKSVVFMGLVTLLHHFANGRIGLAVKEGRIEKVSAMIVSALQAGKLSFPERSSLVGKLQFTIIPAFGQVGRACLWALIRWNSDETSPGSPIGEALRFFLALMSSLASSEESRKFRHLGTCVRDRVLLWSDASYTPAAKNTSASYSGIGYFCLDLKSREKFFVESACTSDLMLSWAQKETHIGRTELVAEILPYLSEPERFRGKDVIHFVDNTSAIYCSIKGYSSDADTAALVYLLHAVMCELDVSVWFEYVPSAENISDGPSRADSELLVNLGATSVCSQFILLLSCYRPLLRRVLLL